MKGIANEQRLVSGWLQHGANAGLLLNDNNNDTCKVLMRESDDL
jgi:hypothetical protein